MSELDQAAARLDQAVSPDAHLETRDENALAGKIFLGLLVAIIVVAAIIWFGGIKMLGPIGIAATLLIFAIMLAFTRGD